MTHQAPLLSVSLEEALPIPAPSRHSPHLLATVWKNFDMLLSDMDFQYELEILGVSKWFFPTRKRLYREFESLTIALWRLALEKSFPEDWQKILLAFLDVRRARIHRATACQAFNERVRTYLTIIERRGDADFTEPAGHLVTLAKVREDRAVAVRLKLALHLRTLYNHLFERLF